MKIGKKFLKKKLKKFERKIFLKIVRLQLLIIETTLMIHNFLLLFFELFDGLDAIIDVRLQKNLSCYIGLMFFNKIILKK